VLVAVAISCVGTVLFGAIFPATGVLRSTIDIATTWTSDRTRQRPGARAPGRRGRDGAEARASPLTLINKRTRDSP
jgi:hypothetical protein